MIDFIKRNKKSKRSKRNKRSKKSPNVLKKTPKATKATKATKAINPKRSKKSPKVTRTVRPSEEMTKRRMKKKSSKFGSNPIKDMMLGSNSYQMSYLNNPRIKLGETYPNENPDIKTALLIVDPQNDFVKDDKAIEDMINIIEMIDEHGSKISDIFITLDCHNRFTITNPMYWTNKQTGLAPIAGTIITRDDFEKEVWVPTRPELLDDTYEYIIALENNNRDPIRIWDEHCNIGTRGFLVYEPLMDAIESWERKFVKSVRYIPKGSDSIRDQFGAIRSEDRVITKDAFISDLDNYTRVLVCGEVLQICVKNSIEDLLETTNIPVILLTDASTVTIDGFNSDFIDNFKMEFSNTFSTSTTEEIFEDLEWNNDEPEPINKKSINVLGPNKDFVELLRNTGAKNLMYKPIAYDSKGAPINPYILQNNAYKGIGLFSNYGPNFMISLLIHRPYYDEIEYVMTKDNRIPSFFVKDLIYIDIDAIEDTDELYDFYIRDAIGKIFKNTDSTKFDYDLVYAGHYAENSEVLNAWKETSLYDLSVPKKEFFASQNLFPGYVWSSGKFADIDAKLINKKK
jgi:nicotinamidase/pyrazinamidase